MPLRLLKGQLPGAHILRVFPRINELYAPFIKALKSGNIQAYDAALEWAEPRLVDMGVFLAVEKAREVCMRCFFRRVYVHYLPLPYIVYAERSNQVANSGRTFAYQHHPVPRCLSIIWTRNADGRDGMFPGEYDLQGLHEGVYIPWTADSCTREGGRCVPQTRGASRVILGDHDVYEEKRDYYHYCPSGQIWKMLL